MASRFEALAKISDVSWEDITSSKYIQPKRVHFKQNGIERTWDIADGHDCVAILVYHIDRRRFVFVRQFRPALYMKRIRELQPDAVLSSDFKWARLPGSLGISIELCAGLMDKGKTPLETAVEELKEELGYAVTPEHLRWVASFRSMGTSGEKQDLFYVEVDETMKVGKGGGNEHEGEMIEVVYVSPSDARAMLFDAEVQKSASFLFCVMWWFEQRLQREAGGKVDNKRD